MADTIGTGDSRIGPVSGAMHQGFAAAQAMEVANRGAAAVVSVAGPSLTRTDYNRAAQYSLGYGLL